MWPHQTRAGKSGHADVWSTRLGRGYSPPGWPQHQLVSAQGQAITPSQVPRFYEFPLSRVMNNSSACSIVSFQPQGLVPLGTYISHTVYFTCRAVLVHVKPVIRGECKTCGNYLFAGISLQFPKQTVASVSSLPERRRMGCQRFPPSRIQLLGWEVAKKGRGNAFQGWAFYWEQFSDARSLPTSLQPMAERPVSSH